jgi:hypothetical protein
MDADAGNVQKVDKMASDAVEMTLFIVKMALPSTTACPSRSRW